MATTSFAGFDPIFLLHHSQIDRLYTLYKDVHDAVGDQDWTASSFANGYAKVSNKDRCAVARFIGCLKVRLNVGNYSNIG